MFLALQRHLMELRPKSELLAPSSPSSYGPPELIELLPWPHPLPSLFKAPVSSLSSPWGDFPLLFADQLCSGHCQGCLGLPRKLRDWLEL